MNRVKTHALKETGFTMIELMIVVAIVGIITTFAIPAYQQYVQEARRSDGQAGALQLIQAQERFFAENLRYTIDLREVGYANQLNAESPEGFYTLTAAFCVAGENDCVQITATGDANATDGNLTVNSLGAKTFVPSDGSPVEPHW